METEKSPVVLPPKVVSNLKLFCDVALENGSPVSLKDLIGLTSIDFTEEELANSWENYFELSRYRVASGVVLKRVDDQKKLEGWISRYERANSNIAYAQEFGALLGKRDSSFKVLSISGSTSYLSVSETDDLDFFCIARSGSMWNSFVRALILARVFRLARKNSPWLCLSYVSDEDLYGVNFRRTRMGFTRGTQSPRG